MKSKKTIMILALASTMVLGVAFAINSSMSYAKNYDKLADEKTETTDGLEKRIKGEPRTRMTIKDIEYEVDYMDGVDIKEGITAIKAIENGIEKIKEIYGKDIDTYLYMWDYAEHDEDTTLESQASWGISYTITEPRVSQTRINFEVDKYTGTCVEKSKQTSECLKPVTIGKYDVYLQKPDVDFDFNAGITVEKAIEIVSEKSKQVFNLNVKNQVTLFATTNYLENKETWSIGMSLTSDAISTDLVSAEIDKKSGEILSLEYQSSARFDRGEAFMQKQDQYWGKDINFEADGATVKARALEYLAGEKNSKYHQIAIDFVKSSNLNQGANIVKAQTVVENSDFMIQLESDIASLRYLVEVELSNGKYIIVVIEKGVDTVYGYRETTIPLEKRLDFWSSRNDEYREAVKELEK